MNSRPKLKNRELLRRIAKYTHITSEDIRFVLEAYYSETRKALLEGKKIEIPDCIMLELKETNRKWCSDFTGKIRPVNPKGLVPSVRAIGALKDELNSIEECKKETENDG